MQTVTPYLLYEDVGAALDFLTRAFGFEETLRYTGGDGYVSHAEMKVGADGAIMLGDPGGEYANPTARHSFAYVAVDDVDAVCERARAAGAEIVREPEDQAYGERTCAARDPQGHEWWFGQPMREAEPEEWGAVVA